MARWYVLGFDGAGIPDSLGAVNASSVAGRILERQRPGARLALALSFISLTICLSACVSNSTVSSRPTNASDSTSTTISRATAKVLRAYRAEWAAFEHALSNADPTDSALTETMVNPLLQQVRRNLVGDQMNGIVGRGETQLRPHISQLTKTSAVVLDCSYSTGELVYSSSGKPVPPITPPENDGIHTILVHVGGAWKVSQQSITEGSCPSGY